MKLKQFFAIALLFLMSCFAAMADTTEQFVKVTDAADLLDGDEIIFANTENQVAMGKTTSSTGRWKAVSVTISGNVLTPTDAVQRITLIRNSGNKFRFKSSSSTYFIANTSSNGFITEKTNNSNHYWNITCCEDSAYVLYYNDQYKLNFDDIFTCYTKSSKHFAVSIYKKTEITTAKTSTKVVFSGDASSFVVKKGKEQEFTAPTATLKDGEDNVIDAALTYTSSNTKIVSVDSSTGAITFNDDGVFGTATITAAFAGDDNYEASSATYSIEYINKSKSQLSFGDDFDGKTITVTQGKENAFTSPTATLTPEGIGDIVYSSSNEAVATVSASGEVTFVATGKTTIKATYSGNDDYQAASASYTISYVSQSILFSDENNSFAKLPTTAVSNKKTVAFVSADGGTYDFSFTYAKLESSKICLSAAGALSLTNPLGFPNGYKVVVNFTQSYSSSSTKFLLSMYYKVGTANTDSTRAVLINENGSNSEFVATLDVPGDYVFTIAPGSNQVKISTIEITPNPVPELTFDEGEDNQNVITANMDKVATVSLKRTLVAAKWNTLCVPFDVADIESSFAGIDVKVYDATKGVVGNTMYFKKVDAIVAGQPYLVKPKTDIVDPTFENVRITAETPIAMGNDDYKFIGVFSPLTFDAAIAGKSLFLAADGTLLSPTVDSTMKGMRAYFSFPGEAQKASDARIVIDDDETFLLDTLFDEPSAVPIFNLQGIYMGNDESKLTKGIYIKNGKKVIVK